VTLALATHTILGNSLILRQACGVLLGFQKLLEVLIFSAQVEIENRAQFCVLPCHAQRQEFSEIFFIRMES